MGRESTGLLNRACRFLDNAEGERNFTDGTVEGSSKMGQIEGIILCTHDHSMRLSASQRIRNAHRSSPCSASRTALSRLCREWNPQFSCFAQRCLSTYRLRKSGGSCVPSNITCDTQPCTARRGRCVRDFVCIHGNDRTSL